MIILFGIKNGEGVKMADLHIKNVSLKKGREHVLKNVSLSINNGEIVSILATQKYELEILKNVVMGFQKIKFGKMFLGKEDITYFNSKKKAKLFEYISSDLKVKNQRSVKKALQKEIKKRIKDKPQQIKKFEIIIEAFKLDDILEKSIKKLNIGELILVKLALAIAKNAQVIVLEEIFDKIPERYKVLLRRGILKLKREDELTLLILTRNVKEAINFSDKIAIFNNSIIEQYGDTKEVYLKPESAAVGAMLGKINVVKGKKEDEHSYSLPILDKNATQIMIEYSKKDSADIYFSIRPENVHVVVDETDFVFPGIRMHGIIDELIFEGSLMTGTINFVRGSLDFCQIYNPTNDVFKIGNEVEVIINPDLILPLK
ncbi:hypothetical protein FC40_GL000827 [Ligilactobacillus hayakitensis DSM 18933 = JCM 14209]|uniref:ABC transporter domain-containing protein n=2 Tax=Ligilactobacillus TaxID=2767887 RepID=A0A0R1WMM0_9LACO|nr:hypothetical protein FC40_GL000827 [Ligilactobacillus hayakitensis DSM 18933 = JCM 14209]